jgi:hypothetical protein
MSGSIFESKTLTSPFLIPEKWAFFFSFFSAFYGRFFSPFLLKIYAERSDLEGA